MEAYSTNYYGESQNSYLTQPVDYGNQQSTGSTQNNNNSLPQPASSIPYSGNFNKATLNFEGNIEEVLLNWSHEEKECKRRLVQFWRSHSNNVITCNFKAVNPADRVPNSIVVSCIFWQEKNEYYITSVDCIYLLESLISVRFTVEEKNRIRRNLEGFRPLTVSKCKPESSEFFKLIMSFPNPKPRNIEKDVKVFPWKILPYALKKIVSKYTATYTNSGGSQPDVGFNMSNYSSYAPTPYGYDRSISPSQSQAQRRFSQPTAFGNYNRNRLVPNASNQQSFMNNGYNLGYENILNSGHRDSITSNEGFDLNQQNQSINNNYAMNPNQLMENNSLHPSMLMSPSKRHLSARRHSVADPYSINNYNPHRKSSIPDISQDSNFGSNVQYSNDSSNQYMGYNQNNGVMRNTIEEEKPDTKTENFDHGYQFQ